MIRVYEPGEVIFTRDAFNNIHRLMVSVHGDTMPEPLTRVLETIAERASDDRSD